MAHFAKIENNNVVLRVIVVSNEYEADGANWCHNLLGGRWIQTSYNTRGGVHYDSNGRPDNGTPLRKNYAAIGDFYDDQNDAFYSKQPYPSWTLDTNTFLWNPPTPYPETGRVYYWDESTRYWQEIGSD